jgi:hypothetical protein
MSGLEPVGGARGSAVLSLLLSGMPSLDPSTSNVSTARAQMRSNQLGPFRTRWDVHRSRDQAGLGIQPCCQRNHTQMVRPREADCDVHERRARSEAQRGQIRPRRVPMRRCAAKTRTTAASVLLIVHRPQLVSALRSSVARGWRRLSSDATRAVPAGFREPKRPHCVRTAAARGGQTPRATRAALAERNAFTTGAALIVCERA